MGERTKAPLRLQDLRRRRYAKAKAEPSWRFWGLVTHICKKETLREASRLAKEKHGAPGSDGVPFEALAAAGAEAFLEQIRRELVQGTYRPMRYRRHLMRARKRRGFGWKRRSKRWLYDRVGLCNHYRVRRRQQLRLKVLPD